MESTGRCSHQERVKDVQDPDRVQVGCKTGDHTFVPLRLAFSIVDLITKLGYLSVRISSVVTDVVCWSTSNGAK